MAESGPRFTVKVGVSRVSVARFDEGRIVWIGWTPTPGDPSDGAPGIRALLSACGAAPGRGMGVLVSVVPEAGETVAELWSDVTGQSLRRFDPERGPFAIRYDPSSSLGQDRSASVWGALVRFPERLGESFLLADFGTHTVTTLFHQGQILGGTIAPGLSLLQRAVGGGKVELSSGRTGERRGLFGRVRGIGPEDGFVGRNTAEGLFGGIVLGTAGAVESLRRRAETHVGQKITLVLTGGWSPLVAPLLSSGYCLNRQLLHYGAWIFLSMAEGPDVAGDSRPTGFTMR